LNNPLPLNILDYKIYVMILETEGVSSEAIAEIARRHVDCGYTIVAGLPKDVYVDPCMAGVAYMHSLEAYARGSRVRSLPLLFLMELLGYRQVRDVVEAVSGEHVGTVVIVGLDRDCVRRAASEIREGRVNLADTCNIHSLSSMVSRSVLRGPRLE